MIVICTGCQARFRVADERIGPRGAKVRCTRCQNVFVAKREPAPPAPPIELDLTPGLGRPAPSRDPFAGGGAPGPVVPFPGATAPGSAAPDPFVAAGMGGFDASPAASDDPFALVPAPAKQPTVKFPPAELGRSGVLGQGAAPDHDPFAPLDPFAAAPRPTATAGQSLAVTDLAQLLGGAAGEPDVLPASQPPAPPPPIPSPAAPGAAAPAGFAAFGEDLTLEERNDGEPAQPAFADPDDVLPADAGPTSFSAAFPPGVWDDGPLGGPAPGDEALALATEKTPAPAAVEPPAPATAAEAPPRPPSRARPEAPEQDAAAAAHPAIAARGRIRSAAVNALALVALVVVALGIHAALRGDEPIGLGALRPSRLLQALGAAQPAAAPFEVVEVRTGLYPQASGGAVLYVRGVVICRSSAPAGGVKVAAELVRDGDVLARGDVLAGAEPTPEDLWKATDRAGLEALAKELGSRAPKKVAAGDRLGFLIALADAPAGISGTSVRLQAGAASR